MAWTTNSNGIDTLSRLNGPIMDSKNTEIDHSFLQLLVDTNLLDKNHIFFLLLEYMDNIFMIGTIPPD